MAQKLDINAQVVLWGDVFPIGKTALVTAYLTLADYFDFHKTKNELWSLTISHADKHSKITADVPQRHYEFELLSLPIDFVERYSTPSAIPIMKSQDGGKRLGYLGTVYRHCGSNGEYACVASEGNKGWVYLPQLGEQKPEIVDFIGGIVRVYRSDWQGATS